jgi:hypothetical protein
MLSDELLTVIKADREREIRAAQRARLADRSRIDEELDDASLPDLDRSIGRIVGSTIQPGRATADPSL